MEWPVNLISHHHRHEIGGWPPVPGAGSPLTCLLPACLHLPPPTSSPAAQKNHFLKFTPAGSFFLQLFFGAVNELLCFGTALLTWYLKAGALQVEMTVCLSSFNSTWLRRRSEQHHVRNRVLGEFVKPGGNSWGSLGYVGVSHLISYQEAKAVWESLPPPNQGIHQGQGEEAGRKERPTNK